MHDSHLGRSIGRPRAAGENGAMSDGRVVVVLGNLPRDHTYCVRQPKAVKKAGQL